MEVDDGCASVSFGNESMPQFVDKNREKHGDRPKENSREFIHGLHPNASSQEEAGEPEKPFYADGKTKEPKS